MRVVTALLAAFVAVRGSFLLDYPLPDDVIQMLGVMEQPKQRALSPCIDVQFNYCQAQFNDALKLGDVTWRNGTYIYQQVQKQLDTSVTNFISVCNTRTQYYQCLGSTYYTCLSLYTLLNRPNADFSSTFDYVRTFRGLEWSCTGGFEEVVQQFGCVGTFPTTTNYQKCIDQFNATLTSANLCSSVSNTGSCLNDAYLAACGDPGAGYYGCENFRSTFTDACWATRCIPTFN